MSPLARDSSMQGDGNQKRNMGPYADIFQFQLIIKMSLQTSELVSWFFPRKDTRIKIFLVKKMTVCLTKGWLKTANEEELAGILAHELGMGIVSVLSWRVRWIQWLHGY